jgi:AAA15 family ATPase/GTPase
MEPIDLGQVNVFIGPNNAGKSSLLRAVSAMQEGWQTCLKTRGLERLPPLSRSD